MNFFKFLKITLTLQLLTVFLQIYKENLYVKTLYAQQQYERDKATLNEQKYFLLSQKNSLPKTLLTEKKRLRLQPISLKQIRNTS